MFKKEINYSETIIGAMMAFALIGIFWIIGFFGNGILAIFLLGFILIFYGWRCSAFAYKTISWPSVDGVVNTSEIKEITVADSQYGASKYYYPHIEYKYSVDGIDYMCDSIGLYSKDYRFYEASEAQNKLENIISSKILIIFYNPREPSWGIIENGLSKKRKEHFLAIQLAAGGSL